MRRRELMFRAALWFLLGLTVLLMTSCQPTEFDEPDIVKMEEIIIVGQGTTADYKEYYEGTEGSTFVAQPQFEWRGVYKKGTSVHLEPYKELRIYDERVVAKYKINWWPYVKFEIHTVATPSQIAKLQADLVD